MDTSVTYDPDEHRVSLDLGSLGLPRESIQALYRAIIGLADKEPDLLTSIAFDGTHLELMGKADDAEKVLAALGTHLEDETLRLALLGAMPTPKSPEPQLARV